MCNGVFHVASWMHVNAYLPVVDLPVYPLTGQVHFQLMVCFSSDVPVCLLCRLRVSVCLLLTRECSFYIMDSALCLRVSVPAPSLGQCSVSFALCSVSRPKVEAFCFPVATCAVFLYGLGSFVSPSTEIIDTLFPV